MPERDFEQEFAALVGEQPSLEELREKATHEVVQFWVGKKIFRLEFFKSSDPEILERIREILEIETQEKLDPVFKELGVPEESAGLVVGLAEDEARKKIKSHGY